MSRTTQKLRETIYAWHDASPGIQAAQAFERIEAAYDEAVDKIVAKAVAAAHPAPAVGTAASALPSDAQGRKDIPLCTGLLDYFTAALAEVAKVSKAGNDQHNPGQPLHWSRGKSTDHADCAVRHLAERGSRDTDGQRHTAKLAWRALALLQEELEAAGEAPMPRGARVDPT